MSYKPKIYVHAPYKPAPAQSIVKDYVLNQLKLLGFEPQEFHVSGLPKGDSWTFQRAMEVMKECDGALVLALMRWVGTSNGGDLPIPSEYSHFEGALALSRNLPTIVLAEDDMLMRGILSQDGGSFVIKIPMLQSQSWILGNQLLKEPPFQHWVDKVNERHDVFFGYCSKADKLAKNIKDYLVNNRGLKVLDWATDFRPGRSIMQEVTRATEISRCGLFLFTADDPIEGQVSKLSMPRDNVLLEAGYFMNAHGSHRMVVVREKNTKMPADLGGMIYLTIDNRNKWQDTAELIGDAIIAQMNG